MNPHRELHCCKYMTRDEFRKAVFQRDDNKCVICGEDRQDAHHIVERRLWEDGGYHLDNGATLCDRHHIEAEQTVLSTEEIREAAGITNTLLPEHLYRDHRYDKWGNVVNPDGTRMRGELFNDPSVQKILKSGSALDLFTKYVKYPRTYHLPWSPGITDDDRVLQDTRHFEGRSVVVTVKMDGENTTFYDDYLHARSIDGRTHPSRSWVKNLHSKIGWQIPKDWRICGENLYAEHSIAYSELDSYFLVFSVWDEGNNCLSWEQTQEWIELLSLAPVPVLYEGIWDEATIKDLYAEKFGNDECEGYVVRLAESYHYSQFRRCVGKFVRACHVSSSQHWFYEQVKQNKLRGC